MKTYKHIMLMSHWFVDNRSYFVNRFNLPLFHPGYIYYCFTWMTTKQGYDYWEKVHNMWYKITHFRLSLKQADFVPR